MDEPPTEIHGKELKRMKEIFEKHQGILLDFWAKRDQSGATVDQP